MSGKKLSEKIEEVYQGLTVTEKRTFNQELDDWLLKAIENSAKSAVRKGEIKKMASMKSSKQELYDLCKRLERDLKDLESQVKDAPEPEYIKVINETVSGYQGLARKELERALSQGVNSFVSDAIDRARESTKLTRVARVSATYKYLMRGDIPGGKQHESMINMYCEPMFRSVGHSILGGGNPSCPVPEDIRIKLQELESKFKKENSYD